MFTSEQVSKGHPDKICDQISDAILTECLKQDTNSRVAIEVMIKDFEIIIAGELTTKASIEYPSIVNSVLSKIGLENIEQYNIVTHVSKQSPDIAMGVDTGGAGDQGIMFGYATNETPEMLPIPYIIATKILKKLDQYRLSDTHIKADAKSQVTYDYEKDRIDTILVSTQHSESVDLTYVTACVRNIVIEVIREFGLNQDFKLLINPTGKFVIGGSFGDTGVTGRKIIADTYGGMARHGGGAFSGKDPSKVDRSAAYMARYLAKYMIHNNLANKCEIQLSYAIGIAEPISLFVNTFHTCHDIGIQEEAKKQEISVDQYLAKHLMDTFHDKLTPQGIIKFLRLKEIDYNEISSYGHFTNDKMPWEQLSIEISPHQSVTKAV